MLDGHSEQLLLEASERHGEVDQRDERRHVGRQVGRRVARRKEHAEALRVVDRLIAHLHREARTLTSQVLPEQGHEDRLDLIDLLQHERLAEAHPELKRVGEARLVRHEDLDGAAARLQVGLEPLERLGGGVDDQGRVVRVQDDDRVLGRELIGGQPLPLPTQELAFGRKEGLHREAPGRADLGPFTREQPSLHEGLVPLLELHLAHVLGLVREVHEEASGQEGRARHRIDRRVELRHHRVPSRALAGELAEHLLR